MNERPSHRQEKMMVSLYCSRDLWERFKVISRLRDLRPNAALVRLVAYAVKNDVIPGVERLDDYTTVQQEKEHDTGEAYPRQQAGEIVGPLRKPRRSPEPSKAGLASK